MLSEVIEFCFWCLVGNYPIGRFATITIDVNFSLLRSTFEKDTIPIINH